MRYLELILNRRAVSRQFRVTRPLSFLKVICALEKVRGDKNIGGIVVNTAGYAAERSEIWELRRELGRCKDAGKKLIIYVDEGDIDTYYLASGADKIVMDGGGMLSFLGYSAEREYYKGTLEKVGIGVRELRYLRYKSAMEGYTRASMSENDRFQYEAYLDDVFAVTKKALQQERALSDTDFDAILNGEFLYSAFAAQKRGLVDLVGREDAILQGIRCLEGEDPVDDSAADFNGDYLADSKVTGFSYCGNIDCALFSYVGKYKKYAAKQKKGLFRKTLEIAVINAEGVTDLDSGMNAAELAAAIRDVSDKKNVRAIVLRVDSPGGSAVAADYIAEALRYAQSNLPVVVTMGSVAASGGYWAAMYADHIVATPYTLTGSIGVIGSWFYDKGVYEKVGVTLDTVTRGDHADLLAGVVIPRRDLAPAEEERFRDCIMDMYRDFVEKAAAGRGMEKEALEKLAQGRVYSGLAAQDAGLIDTIGGLAEALETAKEKADIPSGKRTVYREYPKPTFADLLRDQVFNYFFSAKVLGPVAAALIRGKEHRSAAPFAGLRYRLAHNGKPLAMLPMDTPLKQ